MRNKLWSIIARQLARPAVASWLIERSKRTPYFHIQGDDGSPYMDRFWLFNPYDRETGKPRWAPLIPWSIRIHHIRREDRDEHLHDHPWNARTIILRGSYQEELPNADTALDAAGWRHRVWRMPGDTKAIRFGSFHRIHRVSRGGVYTLFISGKYQGTWGFLVDGVKVKWREYLEARKR